MIPDLHLNSGVVPGGKLTAQNQDPELGVPTLEGMVCLENTHITCYFLKLYLHDTSQWCVYLPTHMSQNNVCAISNLLAKTAIIIYLAKKKKKSIPLPTL